MSEKPRPGDGVECAHRTYPTLVWCFADDRYGPPARRRIPRDGMVLGRECAAFDRPLDDARLADQHAALRRQGGEVLLRDLGSGGGTRLNGEVLLSERALTPGDVIRVGDTLFVYTECDEPESTDAGGGLGASAVMRAVRRSVDAVAPRRHSVVITGETGTGKEVVARAIHDQSGRTGAFVGINCSTFSEPLLASDLFGHVRGAFTGAVSDHPGLFRTAHGGTLLLDEIAEMPLGLQATLLRVLETREVRPVGGTRDIKVDVRVVATTPVELMSLVQSGKFRADLYSRLAQWTVRVPPLRERREDIPLLVGQLLPRLEGAGRRLTPNLAEALLIHEWPLNVRGLLNVLSIAVVSNGDDGPLALTADVQQALASTRSIAPPAQAPAPAPATLDKDELEGLMALFQGKVAAGARHLGITRPRLYRLLWAHGIDPAAYRAPRSAPQ
jgi:DNA-binding NtrC family response regulator